MQVHEAPLIHRTNYLLLAVLPKDFLYQNNEDSFLNLFPASTQTTILIPTIL